MNKPTFYYRQIAPNILYCAGLWFFGLITASCFIVPPILHYMDPLPTPSEAIAVFFMFLGFSIFFLAFFLYIKIRIGGRRKKVYKKFRQLSDDEQARINAELSVKFQQVLWGERRLYIRSGWFLEFVDYDDMAWIYASSTATPIMEDMQYNALSVKIHDAEGMIYKINTTSSYDTQKIIESVLATSPDITFGYSKEKAKLAKKDFGRFLHEERDGRQNAK